MVTIAIHTSDNFTTKISEALASAIKKHGTSLSFYLQIKWYYTRKKRKNDNEIIIPDDTVAFGRFLQILNHVINSPPIPDSLGTYFFGIPNAVLI